MSPSPTRAALAALCLAPAALAQLPAARLSWVFPTAAPAGSTNVVAVAGSDLDEPRALVFSDRRIVGTPVPGKPDSFAVVVPAGVPPGPVDVRFAGRFGVSPPLGFVVAPGPVAAVAAPGIDAAHATPLPRAGLLATRVAANASAWLKLDARKGERLVVSADAASIDSRLVPNLAAFDASGAELARTRRLGWLDVAVPADGPVFVQVSDQLFRGGDDHACLVAASTGPWVDFAVPCVLRAGATNRVALYGRNLPGGKPSPLAGADGAALQSVEADVVAPASVDPASWPAERLSRAAHAAVPAWTWRWTATNGTSNPVLFALATNAVASASTGVADVVPPVEFSGLFPRGNGAAGVAFKARKGDVFQIETLAERLGAVADPHAVVQRDAGGGRWADVAEVGDLDVNPGGTEFNTTSRDGIGRLEVGEDGTYRVLVRDLLHGSPGAPRRPYALSMRKPSPGFALVAWPAPPPKANNDDRNVHALGLVVRRGQTVGVRVAALRRDGHDAAIALGCEGLPPGVAVAATSIPAGQSSGWLLLTASDDAAASDADVRVTGGPGVEARWGAAKWHVPDSNNEAVANRLARRTTLGVVAEPPPLTVAPASAQPVVATAGGKVSIPFVATRRFDSMAAFALKASGHAALEKAPEAKFAEKGTNAVLELNLAEHALPVGTHVLWLQGTAATKYRNQLEALERADAALKAAEKAVASAPADKKAAAEQARKDAEAARKAAEERAKPRDVTITVWSRPFVVRVDPAPKK